MPTIKWLCILSLFWFAFFLSACAVGPNFHSPAAPNTQRYTEKTLPATTASIKTPGGNAQHFNPGQDIPAEWWTLFHSPEIDQLVRQGIVNSPNLAAAQAALRQAQQNLKATIGTGLFPAITGGFGAQRQQFSNDTIGQTGTSLFNLYNVSATVTYTPDVFGGIRRQVEAASAQVEFQNYQVEATYLALTANIVTAAIAEASFRAQILATEELIREQAQQLKIVQAQFDLGGATGSDVLVQETKLAQTRATLPPLKLSLLQTHDALATLVGRPVSEMQLPKLDLNRLHLPSQLPVTLPSTLVKQRPDVKAAEATLHQTSAQIGVATANLLPQFPLTASYGWQTNTFSHLLTPAAAVWLIQGQVNQTIFQGGALIAQRRAAIAAYDQAAAQYRQTVLVALNNVADSLHALQQDALTLRAQIEAERAAYKSLKLTEGQYFLGGTDYVTLLAAQNQYQTSRIASIQAQAARYADTAALFQALGGGWWNRPALKNVVLPAI